MGGRGGGVGIVCRADHAAGQQHHRAGEDRDDAGEVQVSARNAGAVPEIAQSADYADLRR